MRNEESAWSNGETIIGFSSKGEVEFSKPGDALWCNKSDIVKFFNDWENVKISIYRFLYLLKDDEAIRCSFPAE